MARRQVTNKVRNGNFEFAPAFTDAQTASNAYINGTLTGTQDNTYGWMFTKGGTASAQFDSNVRYSGSFSMKLDCTVGSGGTLGQAVTLTTAVSPSIVNQRSFMIPVLPSTSYTLKAMVKTENVTNNNSGGVRIRALFYSGQSTISVGSASSSYITGTNDWQLVTLTFTTSATGYFINIWLNIFDETGTAWFDDITLDTTTPTTRTTATSRSTATNRVAVRDMGTALRFDGSGDRVSLPAGIRSVVSKSSTEFTLSVWFRPTAVSGTYQIFGSAVDTNDRFAVTISASTLRIGIWNGASWNSGSGGRTVQPGVWSNLTVVSAGGLITAAYLNGIQYAPQGGVNPVSSGTAGTFVGIRSDGTTEAFLGVIDEPRIWNRALTATEIQNLYLHGAVPQDGLVAEYLFDEASGTTALDTSGNGNHGTITGATYTTDTPLRPRTSV